ncbi:hypothetical protein [Quadrisphaera setariae]|uniref:Tetratricopeptide repeat-containing protein n=1 Tax=Quadrisphaera setariae TaxID=2593304 RepID=A0A5C8ZET6_9ACTN|nr:hypothetical protein [Quadrisphaera setariae]TXR55799.1 hypothetical protein FMM08_13365 [Quadrisphaera setariae]
MKTKVVVGLLLALLLLYLVLLGQRGVVLITDGTPAGAVLGVGVLILPVVVVWAIARELAFGVRTEKMAHQLEREGRLPPDDLPRNEAGRIDRDAADAAFERYRAETEAAPEDFGSWFRLACAYDVAGDRKRARAAMRRAGALHKASTT